MAGREPIIVGTNRITFNHSTMIQIVEHFLNNNLFKGGAVNQVQVDGVEQGRFRVDPEDTDSPVEKRFTVEYRNMDEVRNEQQ